MGRECGISNSPFGEPFPDDPGWGPWSCFRVDAQNKAKSPGSVSEARLYVHYNCYRGHFIPEHRRRGWFLILWRPPLAAESLLSTSIPEEAGVRASSFSRDGILDPYTTMGWPTPSWVWYVCECVCSRYCYTVISAFPFRAACKDAVAYGSSCLKQKKRIDL